MVKRPTRNTSELRAADYRRWAPVLKAKLERYSPLIVCFHGAVAYRNYLKYAEGVSESVSPWTADARHRQIKGVSSAEPKRRQRRPIRWKTSSDVIANWMRCAANSSERENER